MCLFYSEVVSLFCLPKVFKTLLCLISFPRGGLFHGQLFYTDRTLCQSFLVNFFYIDIAGEVCVCVLEIFTVCSSILTLQGNIILFGNICGSIKGTNKREEIQKWEKDKEKCFQLLQNVINYGVDSEIICNLKYFRQKF